MSYVAAAVSLGTLAYGIYNSETQKAEAKKALGNLKHENFTVSPEMQGAYNRAQQMSQYGFSPAEKAAFRQNKAQDINTQAQRALDIGGGNMARTISKLGQISNLGAENQFAGQDAALHRQNIHYADSLAGQLQGQKNRATGESINQYNRAETAYGNAYAQNQTNENQLIGQLPYLASTFAGSGAGQQPVNGQRTMQQNVNATPNTNYDYTNPKNKDYYNAYQYSQFG